MIWVRHNWASRILAVVLIVSMLPALVVPASRAASGMQFGSYERWIRAQLRIPVDEHVEEAISRAVASRAHSFEAFVATFLEAYEQTAPERPIAQVFTDRDLSDDALISYLQRRYTQVVDDGVLTRTFLAKAAAQSSSTIKAGKAAHAVPLPSTRVGFEGAMLQNPDDLIVIPFRVLSSARSLGP